MCGDLETDSLSNVIVYMGLQFLFLQTKLNKRQYIY